ncbi:MAG TPA: response regulator [Candidatus Binatia bacterium]|jgi:DNA-binding response OmpR family regulator
MPIPILVVDDEPNFQALMHSALGKRGFLVSAVSNGTEALKRLETSLFDFALIDLKLVDESGLDVLGAIKRRQPRIHALVVTAFPTDESRMMASDRGAAAYLTKPLDLSLLLKTFQSVLAH